jgi:hypothetical protein
VGPSCPAEVAPPRRLAAEERLRALYPARRVQCVWAGDRLADLVIDGDSADWPSLEAHAFVCRVEVVHWTEWCRSPRHGARPPTLSEQLGRQWPPAGHGPVVVDLGEQPWACLAGGVDAGGEAS